MPGPPRLPLSSALLIQYPVLQSAAADMIVCDDFSAMQEVRWAVLRCGLAVALLCMLRAQHFDCAGATLAPDGVGHPPSSLVCTLARC